MKLFQDKSYQVLSVNFFGVLPGALPLRGKEDSNLAAKPLTLNPSPKIPKIYRARLSEYKISGFNISCMLHFSLASYGKWWEWISFPSHLVSNHRARQVLEFSGEKIWYSLYWRGKQSLQNSRRTRTEIFANQTLRVAQSILKEHSSTTCLNFCYVLSRVFRQ